MTKRQCTWLHFIGKSYYSRASFEKEARAHGITRRVSLATAKRMEFGDRVLLAMKDGKSTLIFGAFVVRSITGLSPDAQEAIGKTFDLEMIHPGGGVVSRGCGDCAIGPTFAFVQKVEMEEIVARLEEQKEAGEDIGHPMVGGDWEDFPLVRLKSVPHTKGFRLFDEAGLADAVVRWMDAHPGKSIPQLLRQHFYAKPDDFTAPLPDDVSRQLGVFTSYYRLEELKALQKQERARGDLYAPGLDGALVSRSPSRKKRRRRKS